MRVLKRSASQAQLPTTVHKSRKRFMHSLPSRRTTQDAILGDAPDGESLLNRWATLVSDTFHALWEKSAKVASRVLPPEADGDATFDTPPERPMAPGPPPLSPLPKRLPIPQFGDPPPPLSTPHLPSSHTTFPQLPLQSNSGPAFDGCTQPSETAFARQKYQRQSHIHMAQHKKKVEEHNYRELEKLRNRRASISNDLDMEVALKFAKQEAALTRGAQLTKQWKVEKATGFFHSDLDSFMDFQTYKQLVLDQSLGKINLSSPSLPNLNEPLVGSSRERLQSSGRRGSFNLERTLQIAHQSLNEPRLPSPLSFDKLRLTARKKDREIEKRIRDATRLPTKLPPHVYSEVKALRLKRGIVAKVAREQVADTDLSRLDPGGTLHWLNDEIINFYGALVLERAERYASGKENMVNGSMKKRKAKVEYLDVHYFSTFFWPKIEKSYKDTRLNKWTKKLDIFSKDMLLIPVNHGNVHWTLAAINLRKKRIESYDSMGVYRENVYKNLRCYLQEEHMDKKKKPFDFTGWIDYFDEDTPQQENGHDCGVFTCQFMESLSRGIEHFGFDQGDMRYIRDRMTWEIGNSRLWEDTDA